MMQIHYWPDGTWCRDYDLVNYGWMSDDYATIEVSFDIDDEQIDDIVARLI